MIKGATVTLLLLLTSQTALAEVFKCKTAQGKTIYSETPCEGTPSSRVEIIDNKLDSNHLRWEAYRNQMERAQERMKPAAAETHYMSDYDKQKRISENMVSLNSATASDEKRYDAEYENYILQKNPVRVLGYEENRKRANLKVDLNSLEAAKRQKAAQSLKSLYQQY